LQTWIRNASLEPDWLRVGTDIIGGTTFNAAFALTGETTATVPEPATLALLLVAFAATVAARGRAALGGLLASSMKRARISHRSAPLR